MKALCILPVERAAVAALSRRCPLALMPFLGRTVLEHVLAYLAEAGAKEVVLLAADRPAEIRRAVGNGEAWGMTVQVLPESRELTPDEARAKYHAGDGPWLAAPHDVFSLEHLPQLPAYPLWASYRGFFAAALRLLPQAAPARVGMRELSPGVWVGLRSRVAASARISAPSWIGANAWIGPRAVVGPNAIIEDGACLDDGVEVNSSLVGPRTYVGTLTCVSGSFAWGGVLLNLESGSVVEVPDRFLLADLHAESLPVASSLAGRAAAVLMLALTSPLVLIGALKKLGTGTPLFVRREAVPASRAAAQPPLLLSYRELAGFRGLARRWPQLWSVARGDFVWVGNRPLTPEEAVLLTTEYERLWLTASPGLLSLADAMGCRESFGDEARAHASFFAVDPAPRKHARVLGRLLRRVFLNAPNSES